MDDNFFVNQDGTIVPVNAITGVIDTSAINTDNFFINPDGSIVAVSTSPFDSSSATIYSQPSASIIPSPSNLTGSIDPTTSIISQFTANFPNEAKLIPATQYAALASSISKGMVPYINSGDQTIMLTVNALASIVGSMQGQLSSLTSAVGTLSKPATSSSSVLGAVESAVGGVVHAVEGAFTTTVGGVISAITSVGKTVGKAVSGVVTSIGNAISHLFSF